VTIALVVVVIVALGLGVALVVVAGRRRGLQAEVARLERGIDDASARTTALEAERLRLERAFDAIPQGVVLVDDQGEVVVRNTTAAGFSGARHGEALVEAAVAELMTDALKGRVATRTVDLFGPPRRTVVITATPISVAERRCVLAVIDDVSERRRLEAVRRDFVANISHELKTPVGALGLLAETLLAEDDPAVAQRLAERIQTEAFRVGHTIEDLLELSRIESGELPSREVLPVHVVVSEAVERIRPAAEQAGIVVELSDSGRDLTLLGDRRQLISALYNLLDNAVKYSDEESTVEVGASRAGESVEIAVTDHGIGIPVRDLGRVFERFYRVDQARSRRTGGTGLGLSIVRHVVGNHHGDIRVESRLGEGSTFTLCLPAAAGVADEIAATG